MSRWVLWILLLALVPGHLRGETVRVAVSANFLSTVEQLSAPFTNATGHELSLSSGATGQLYAQIVNGAPFDVFLSADQARPLALVAAGLAEPESRFTYASGRLVFVARDPSALAGARPDFSRITTLSIANPATAPYGVAAAEALAAMEAPATLRIARAQSVSGAWSAVMSGASDAGIVALSALREAPSPPPAHAVLPADLHAPIRQDAVLLTRGADTAGARAFLAWLGSAPTRALIRAQGYDVD